MKGNDGDELSVRLKVRARKVDDGRIVSRTLRRVRNTLRKRGGRICRPGAASGTRKTAHMRGAAVTSSYRPTLQRCAVRMSFAANKAGGQWAAHGRYIARESARAAADGQQQEAAFTATGRADAHKELARWQEAGDPRMFKFILSPEFGQDMDSMEEFTRSFMDKLEKDLGTPLEWVAVDHYNTDHPHVHVALRGVDREGQPLLLRPDYVKKQLRVRAQEAATEQLGFRTEKQHEAAFEREVGQQRFTSLDRALKKRAEQTPSGIVSFADQPPKHEGARKMRLYQIRRLVALEKMGLAHSVGSMQWMLDEHMEGTLRGMQETGDILKTMYSARDIQSDPRMQVQKLAPAEGQEIEGRLIATHEDEASGKPCILLESPEGVVYHIYQTKAMQAARAQGTLKRGDFVSVAGKAFERSDGKKVIATVFKNHGSSHKLLTNADYLAKRVLRGVHRTKALPKYPPLAGWLGKYQQAIQSKADELVRAGVIRPGADGLEVTVQRRRQPGLQQTMPQALRPRRNRGMER